MQIYNVKKLHLQANLCEVLAKNKNQNFCRDQGCGSGPFSVEARKFYRFRTTYLT